MMLQRYCKSCRHGIHRQWVGLAGRQWLSSSSSSASWRNDTNNEYTVRVCDKRRGVEVLSSNHNDDDDDDNKNKNKKIVVSNGWLWRNAEAHTMAGTGQRMIDRPPPPELDRVELVLSNDPIPSKKSAHMLPSSSSSASSQWWLHVSWKNSNTSARYPLSWLQDWSTVDTASSQVTCEDTFIHKYQGQIARIPYSSCLLKDPFPLFHTLFQDGAVLLHDIPIPVNDGDGDDETVMVRKLAKVLGGRLSHKALYGDVFHVLASPTTEATNIAYTNHSLPPHQDLIYYQSPPGFQLLHCMANDTSQGGQSTLIDGLAAAHAFSQLHPHFFQTLTQTSATFVKQRPPHAHMIYQRPHILTNTHHDIVAINWAPPFQGPLSLSSHSLQQQHDYDMAFTYFEQMLDKYMPPPSTSETNHTDDDDSILSTLRQYAQTYTWEYSLQPGEMIIFNNRRMLHGRRAFTLDGKRHLIGGYTDMDDTLHNYRLLLSRQPNQSSHNIRIPNVGNETTTTFP